MTQIRPEQDYRAYLAQGQFMLQRSRTTGQHIFYPRVAEPRTGSLDLEWVPASGVGSVYATTVVRVRPPEIPYNVALIDLAEGPRIMSRVEGVLPDQVRIGMAVRARITDADGQPVLVFDVAAGGSEGV